MFKNVYPLCLAVPATVTLAAMEQALAAFPFTPCGDTQPESAGWVPPRGTAHAALVESINGAWFMRYAIQTKSVPGATIKARADEICARLEQERGYKPGRREAKEIKEQALLELLPQAFRKTVHVNVCIIGHFLLIDTSAAGKTDDVVTALVRLPLPEGLRAWPLQTAQAPAGAMAAWLADGEAPGALYLDRECTLESADEMRSKVRYTRKPLDTDEIKAHIAAGMRPTQLALTWDERASFVLTPALVLRRFEVLDVALGERAEAAEDEAFDADAAIFCGEVLPLLKGLAGALGGIADEPGAAPAPAIQDADQCPA